MKADQIPWPELKEKIMAMLPDPNDEPVTFQTREGVIIDEIKFVRSHVSTIDAYPKKPNLTLCEINARKYVVKPFYDRLLAYYRIKELQSRC